MISSDTSILGPRLSAALDELNEQCSRDQQLIDIVIKPPEFKNHGDECRYAGKRVDAIAQLHRRRDDYLRRAKLIDAHLEMPEFK